MNIISDRNVCLDNNKSLSLLISAIKNPLWEQEQYEVQNTCLLRELFQKCSGGKIIEMLKKILLVEEKSALVKDELQSFFQLQAQNFENHMKMKTEVTMKSEEGMQTSFFF